MRRALLAVLTVALARAEDLIATVEVTTSSGPAVAELHRGEESATAATSFCNRVSNKEADCVGLIADALRSRAAERTFRTSARSCT